MRHSLLFTLLAPISIAFLATNCGNDDAATITDLDADSEDVGTEDADTEPEDADTNVNEDADAEPEDADVEPEDADVEPEDADTNVDTDTSTPVFTPFCPSLTNANAETGDISGWIVDYGEFEAQEETGNYPAAFEGTYYFTAGGESTSGMHQDLDISDDAEAIDAGLVYANFSLWVRNYDGDDEASFQIEALAANGSSLASNISGGWKHTNWLERVVSLHLPEGTRTLRVHLRGVRDSGFANDAYFDLLSVCLNDVASEADITELLSPPYLMWATETEVTIRFESENPIIAQVDYGPTGELGSTFIEGGPTRMHEIRLTGLSQSSTNYYQISWNDAVLPVWDFKTALAAEDESSFNFVFFADNQDGPEHFEEIVDMMAAEDPSFVLSAGDNVQNGKLDEYQSQLWQPFFGLGNEAAFLTSGGNHETYSSLIIRSDTSRALWDEQVSQPSNEHCFGWRWGQMFTLFVDSERDYDVGSEQYTCVEQILASDLAQSARYRTVVMHRPPLIQYWDSVAIFPSSISFEYGGMDAEDVREHLAPLFEEHGVHLVFNGHNHLYSYAEFYPESISWVTSGGGGGGLESGAEDTMVRDWSDFVVTTIFGQHHYLSVSVSTEEMIVTAINTDGEEMHSFTIVP